jgi:hypothetical protein
MPLIRAFRFVPTNLLEWSRWIHSVEVTPDPGTVTEETIGDGEVTLAKLEDSAAVSVIGRSANTTGTPADIVAASNGLYLGRRSNAVAFQQIKNTEVFTDQTAAELAAGVTPANYSYREFDIRRYGAVLDDSTDCLLPLRACAAVCLAAGGGEIYIPGPVRTSNTIYITSNTWVHGDGFHCSVKPTADVSAFDGSSIFVALRDYAGGGVGDDPSDGEFADYYGPHEDIRVEDLHVQGPSPFQTGVSATRTGSAIHIQMCSGVAIERLWVDGASDACIRVDGYGSGAFTSDESDAFWANTTDVFIHDCLCENGFIGIELEGLVTRALVSGNTVSDCARALRNAASDGAEWTGNITKSLVEDTIETVTLAFHAQKMKRGKVHHNTLDATVADPDYYALLIQNAEDCQFDHNQIPEGYIFVSNLSPAPDGFNATSVMNTIRHNTLLTDGVTYASDGVSNVAINLRVGTGWDVSNNKLPNSGAIYVRPTADGGAASGRLCDNIATVSGGRTSVVEWGTQRPSDHRVESNGCRYTTGANGHTVLHPDGTKVCWHTVTVAISSATSGTVTWTFQTGDGAFTATPTVLATIVDNAGSDFGKFVVSASNASTTTSTIRVREYAVATVTLDVDVSVYAIGRWK